MKKIRKSAMSAEDWGRYDGQAWCNRESNLSVEQLADLGMAQRGRSASIDWRRRYRAAFVSVARGTERPIVSRPLWYMTDAPVTRKERVAHVTYDDGGGGAVCGANLHGSAYAVTDKRVRRCADCEAWLDARLGEPLPAVCATHKNLW